MQASDKGSGERGGIALQTRDIGIARVLRPLKPQGGFNNNNMNNIYTSNNGTNIKNKKKDL